MTQRNVSLTDKAYNMLNKTKVDYHNTSFSKVIIQLINEHHELAKIRLEQARTEPQTQYNPYDNVWKGF